MKCSDCNNHKKHHSGFFSICDLKGEEDVTKVIDNFNRVQIGRTNECDFYQKKIKSI